MGPGSTGLSRTSSKPFPAGAVSDLGELLTATTFRAPALESSTSVVPVVDWKGGRPRTDSPIVPL